MMASGSENIALVNELAHRLNDNTRRIRVLEEKVRNFELQIEGHDRRLVEASKEANAVSQTLAEELSRIKERLAATELDIQAIRAGMKKSAQKADLREIQDYIELISPITTKFATRGEVEEIVRAELRRQNAKKQGSR